MTKWQNDSQAGTAGLGDDKKVSYDRLVFNAILTFWHFSL